MYGTPWAASFLVTVLSAILLVFFPFLSVAAAKKNNCINMYTVFAELPGGSGALFANLVNGAILLTVRALNF